MSDGEFAADHIADYIIVGAGSAGCVLANRLSADPRRRVLLLEAGPEDRSPFIHMPRGAARLYTDPRHVWYFQTEAHDAIPSETWMRGKMLGGSSSINGMMYFRGQPEDYDGWEALGAAGWGWSEMGAAFRAIEDHELGADGERGVGGPLGVSISPERSPLTEAFIAAGTQMGVSRVADLNHPRQEGVGYTPRTVKHGRRVSAAKAFLKPARGRPNLRVVTGVTVDRLRIEAGRAVAVEARVGGVRRLFRTAGEIIVSAGALGSPPILQRSGIGDAAHLRGLGIEVVADSPGVGAHMLEHRLLMVRYDLAGPHSDNPQFRGARLVANVARYFLTRRGPMTGAYGPVGAFVRALAESATPDTEILMSPVVADANEKGDLVPDAGHSIQLFGYPLRSRSEGHVRIAAADPATPPSVRAGYLTDPYDCAVTVAMHRLIRRWMAMPALAPLVAGEREPTRSLQSDDEILDAFRTQGQAGYHACGTCRMGAFNDAVLDSRLRVKGVAGLRVVDGSILPTMVSANTNGPIMAAAWRAAQLIVEDGNAR